MDRIHQPAVTKSPYLYTRIALSFSLSLSPYRSHTLSILFAHTASAQTPLSLYQPVPDFPDTLSSA